MDTTKCLKAELWKNFSSTDYSAEWDGCVYGGGKISQRFWEYFSCIELMNLSRDSVLLDIGGGSPATGIGFFSMLVHKFIKQVIIIDPNINKEIRLPPNVIVFKEFAEAENLQKLFQLHPDVTHVAAISVFEHMDSPTREGLIRTVDNYFSGGFFVATFEYHSKRCYFENQLTCASAGSLLGRFNNFYLTKYLSSPVWCENAYGNPVAYLQSRRFYTILPQRLKLFIERILDIDVPQWYPVAVKFERIES